MLTFLRGTSSVPTSLWTQDECREGRVDSTIRSVARVTSDIGGGCEGISRRQPKYHLLYFDGTFSSPTVVILVRYNCDRDSLGVKGPYIFQPGSTETLVACRSRVPGRPPLLKLFLSNYT